MYGYFFVTSGGQALKAGLVIGVGAGLIGVGVASFASGIAMAEASTPETASVAECVAGACFAAGTPLLIPEKHPDRDAPPRRLGSVGAETGYRKRIPRHCLVENVFQSLRRSFNSGLLDDCSAPRHRTRSGLWDTGGGPRSSRTRRSAPLSRR